MIDRDDFQKAYGKVVARAWADPEFKELLLRDARAALATVGIEYPVDIKVFVRENNPREMNLVLPPQPAEGELSEQDIDKIADLFDGEDVVAGQPDILLLGHTVLATQVAFVDQ